MTPIWKTRPLLCELLLAAVLSGIYFWFVQDYAVGILGNNTNGEIFSACSVPAYYLSGIEDVWKGRLAGLLLSGGLFDFMLNHTAGSLSAYAFVFGLYQAGWLFLLFLVIILSLRRAWLINLGIFAGVMYDFFPASGLYVYPWDIPATLFFTLAALLFERRQMALMILAVAVGCFYKETVLICALLVFFATQWPWWRRLVTFGALVTIYVLGKKILLHQLHVHAAALSMNDAKTVGQVLQTWLLVANLKTLCSWRGLYDVFANAGTMTAVLLLGWRKRFLPYLLLILAFLAGQLMYGSFLEFRIFMQILPLSLILLSETWPGSPVTPAASNNPRLEILLANRRPLAAIAILLTVFSIVFTAGRYWAILDQCDSDQKTNRYVQSDAAIRERETFSSWCQHAVDDTHLRWTETLEDSAEQQKLKAAADWFQYMYVENESTLGRILQTAKRYPEALPHYRITMALTVKSETNSPMVDNNLAWYFATVGDPQLRNGPEAMELARQACVATQYREPAMVGTLAVAYAETGDFTNAIKYCRQARELARTQSQTNLMEENDRLLKLYESGHAWHETVPAGPRPKGAS